MNKKGSENTLLEILSQLIIIALIVASFFSVTVKLRDNTVFQQKAQVIETSLIHDMIQYSPSKIDYALRLENKTIKIDSCKITLQGLNNLAYTYYCANNHISASFKETINNNILLLKNEKSTA